MSEHLSDRELAQLLAGNGDERPHVHVAECDECRAEAERMRAALSEFRGDVQQRSEHDDFFWSRQRNAIMAAADRPVSYRLRWAVSFVVAIAALSTAMLVPSAHHPTPARMAVTDDHADEQLLLAVQADLSQDAPDALAPAEVLQQERATLLAQLEEKKQERRNTR